MIFLRNRPSKSIILIITPLVLSAFIHLWNPKGFPPLYFDEGIYMRRAMNMLETHSPQEDPYFYDHPYFGQTFLAGIFWMTGYPSSLHPSVSIKSIETLYSFPRILMGVLAIIDTLLVYKISERRYSRNVAFIASTLFCSDANNVVTNASITGWNPVTLFIIFPIFCRSCQYQRLKTQ